MCALSQHDDDDDWRQSQIQKSAGFRTTATPNPMIVVGFIKNKTILASVDIRFTSLLRRW
jgi:hypothetical protein